MKKFSLIAVSLAVLWFAGCASHHKNAEIENFQKDAGYRFANAPADGNSDSLFVVLTFSGGGTRAAALSYGVLEYLRDTKIAWEGKRMRLLDEVDVISSVSGGSFTSAYYGLYGDGIFGDDKKGIESDFQKNFLNRNIESALLGQVFSPANFFRLALPTFDRVDMAGEYYDEHIFGGATFQNLYDKKKRPFILINATDMSLGARFEFTQEQFDLICSDLLKFPVGRAVAASSAFPVLLSPVTLKNYGRACGFQEPQWVSLAMKDTYRAPRRYLKALEARSYGDAQQRPFIHLLDGGLADNLGIRAPYYGLFLVNSGWDVLRMINEKKIKKIAFIVANAKTDPDTGFDGEEAAPGFTKVLVASATTPMDNYTFETVELLRETFKDLAKESGASGKAGAPREEYCKIVNLSDDPNSPFYLQLCTVILSFDLLKDPREQRFFNNLGTNFNLGRETVGCLRHAAGKLLTESPEFKEFLTDLNAERPALPYDQGAIDRCVNNSQSR